MHSARSTGQTSPRAAPAPSGPLGLASRLPGLLRAVGAEIDYWQERAAAIPDGELRRQAQASLSAKRFHCEGGAVYALALPRLLPAVVALQTISDYLDNLADRSAIAGARDLGRLHLAFLDALQPGARPRDYYSRHSSAADGGYLRDLVATSQGTLAALPGWPAAFPEARRLAGWYCALQVRKHIQTERREVAVRRLARRLPADGMDWWEAAAAAGSTLGLFALFAAAADPGLTPAAAVRLRQAYFPAVTGLHILLDYWIDLDEDRVGGDFNFAACYADPAVAARRLGRLLRRARWAVRDLPDASFHRTVVDGLPAIYLADRKVDEQGLAAAALRLLFAAGPATWLFWLLLRSRGA